MSFVKFRPLAGFVVIAITSFFFVGESVSGELRSSRISLRIIIDSHAEGDFLFDLRNISGDEVNVDKVGVNDNRLAIITPSGNNIDIFHYRREPSLVAVKPGESYSWRINFRHIIPTTHRERGVYKMKWVYLNREGTVECSSNFVFVDFDPQKITKD